MLHEPSGNEAITNVFLTEEPTLPKETSSWTERGFVCGTHRTTNCEWNFTGSPDNKVVRGRSMSQSFNKKRKLW